MKSSLSGITLILSRNLFIGLLACWLLTLASCGGGNPQPTPDANTLKDQGVRVTLPSGIDATGATLETPYGSSGLSGLGGTVSVSTGGQALTSVVKNGKVLLLGFVSPNASTLPTLDVRSTATVFAFYALNGPFLEPTMQGSLIGFLNESNEVKTLASTVASILSTNPASLSIDNPVLKSALETLRGGLSLQGLRSQSVSVNPDRQASGIFVRETKPLADAVNVYNNFRRPVFVYVDRVTPQPGPVSAFALPGASVEASSSAIALQSLIGFAHGDVPRTAVKSADQALPVVNDQNTTYQVTVVGAGSGALTDNDPSKSQRARDLALNTAIEEFLAPNIGSALETGAKERTASDLAAIVQGLSSATIDKLEAGDFEQGINDAFRELFNAKALPTTIDKVLKLYYPNIRSKDTLQNMRERLTRNFSVLVGASASSVSLNGNGIIGTVRNSKRLERFQVETKAVKLRVLPEQSNLGKGGQAVLTAQVQLPAGETATGLTYRWTLTGAGAGYAVDGGVEKIFPLETASTTLTYKHRDTINVLYGTDTITVEALRTQGTTVTVIAKGTASVTVREHTITLTPQTSELAFGDEQTFTANVDPKPATGTLTYVFYTSGRSTFVGGAQTSSGPNNTVRFRQSNETVGQTQNVNVSVVLEDAGKLTVLGETKAVVTVKEKPLGLQNADFSQGLKNWLVFNQAGAQVTVSSGDLYGCLPSSGKPHLEIRLSAAAYTHEVYVYQTFVVPATAKTLSVRTWNYLNPNVNAKIAFFAGQPFEVFRAPALVKEVFPQTNPKTFECTGNAPATRTYDISQYAGKTATMNLWARYSGIVADGEAILGFDSVSIK
jgi:hypothetical protein